MSKRSIIRSLEISDFRGLQGVRTLNFEGVDIVLLLGLNGFGKTSVFDAIEWCLTGKLGRYERYTESGRKQDFGKEKEILRNKYAAKPNTFAKVTLQNGMVFGRRVLSDNNESDYNMGSIIKGCKYGLDALTKDSVKEELVNSYFSATHILSQETINHFVTSKKPEERYQALSVNFGTAVFSPFEANIQVLLNKIISIEKDIKQDIVSKNELIQSLKFQIASNIKDVSKNIEVANELIKQISDLNTNFFHKLIIIKDGRIVMDASFEKYVSNAKPRANLDYNEEKKKMTIIVFLKENFNNWENQNKVLKETEIKISKIKQSLSKLDELRKAISALEAEVNALNERLTGAISKKMQAKQISMSLSHFIATKNKISEIEAIIKKRVDSLLEAKNNLPKTEKQLEILNENIVSIKSDLDSRKYFLAELYSQKEFFSTYSSLQKKHEDEIKKQQEQREQLRSNIEIYYSFLSSLEVSSKPSNILNILDNPTFQSIVPKIQVDSLRVDIASNAQLNEEIEKQFEEFEQLTKEERNLMDQLSKSRKLLSSALSHIDKTKDNHNCPVCDALHQTSLLIECIESKLGSKESESIATIKNKQKNLKEKQNVAELRKKTLQEELKRKVQKLTNNIVQTLAKITSDETALKKSIDNLLNISKKVKDKHDSMFAKSEEILGKRLFDYGELVQAVNTSIGDRTTELGEKLKTKESLIKTINKYRKLILDVETLNQSDLSEITALKDTLFTNAHNYLESAGLFENNKSIEVKLTEHLSALDNEENNLKKQIKEKSKGLYNFKQNQNKILKDTSELDIRKNLFQKESQLDKLKQSLNKFLQHLFQLNISPADYSYKNINNIEEVTKENIKKNEKKYSALDQLVSLISTFNKFNRESISRQKVEQIMKDIETLEAKEKRLKTAKTNIDLLKKKYPSVLKSLIKDNLDINLFNQIYELLNPHRHFKIIDFNVNVSHNRIGINFNAQHSKIKARPEFLFSSAQLNTFGICMFLSMALRQNWLDLDTILIDDPIQNLDDINILSFIDFLRSLLDSKTAKKQIILSTHDERFYNLMIRKFQDYEVKLFKFESYGKLTPDIVANS